MTSTDFDGIYAIHQRGAISILEYFWEGGEGRNRFEKTCHAPVLYMQTVSVPFPPSLKAADVWITKVFANCSSAHVLPLQQGAATIFFCRYAITYQERS